MNGSFIVMIRFKLQNLMGPLWIPSFIFICDLAFWVGGESVQTCGGITKYISRDVALVFPGVVVVYGRFRYCLDHDHATATPSRQRQRPWPLRAGRLPFLCNWRCLDSEYVL